MKNFTLRFLMLLAFAILISPAYSQTVVDIIVGSENHETLETAVLAAELADDLSGEGPFTVFAPTDAAFAALPDGTLESLLEDPTGRLAEILLYHAVGAKALSTELSDQQELVTLFGQEVLVTINDQGVFINDARVTVADLEADNGVVHVIDAVMVPSYDLQLTENETYGTIMTDGNGNSLYFFTRDAGTTSLCQDACIQNWPIFNAGSLYVSAGLNPDDFGSIERADGMVQTTFKGWPLYYFVNDNAPGDVNGEGIINAWYVARHNYTIMLVDNQLTGHDGKNYRGDYTEGNEVIQYLTDGNGYTLYSFVRDFYGYNSFTAADFSNNGVWPVYEADDIVVPSVLQADDFAFVDVFGTMQLTYKGWPLYYFGQDAMVRGSNKGVSFPVPGVWPVLTADFAPAKERVTVVDIVVESADHTILETAVVAAELADDLSGKGPFTVFAPTDAAFGALPEGTLESLLEDPTGDLAQILLYHVASGQVLSGDLSDEQMIETLLGEQIRVSISDEGVFINDARVTVADIQTDNGVIHVLDAVLLPGSITSVSTPETALLSDMLIYPNPVRDRITIRLDIPAEEARLQVMDITGQIVFEREIQIGESTLQISAENYKPGIYFARLFNPSWNISKKIQIVR